MSAIRITLAGVEGPQAITAGVAVALAVTSPSIVDSYSWELITPSAASAAVLSSATAAAPTFTPDVEGSYEIKLSATVGTTTIYASTYGYITTERAGDRIPAPQETTESGDDDRGWHNARYDQLIQQDRLIGPGGSLVVCVNDEGAAVDVGSVVRLSGWSAAGSFTGRLRPTIELADLADALDSIYGVIVSPQPGADGDVTTATVADGANCLVCFSGLVDNAIFDGVVPDLPGRVVGISTTPGQLASTYSVSAVRPIGILIKGGAATAQILIGRDQRHRQVITTTDATPTRIYSVSIAEDQARRVEVDVVGIVDDGSAAGGYSISGTVRRDGGGNVALVGGGYDLVAREDAGAWDVTLVADVPSQSAIVYVVGAAATTINWAGEVRCSLLTRATL